ncbi:hypothetical protein Cgig2_003886 [Carnegiea gigantea]|uniref:Uncharacterized protein n=1 Tax=Carnegiea gigantea TaxID=171969 RepID=A0A9Q1JTX7_9CARY|nr:hypothetical protein Cgig2_003886 [Carnegiea gigantea]
MDSRGTPSQPTASATNLILPPPSSLDCGEVVSLMASHPQLMGGGGISSVAISGPCLPPPLPSPSVAPTTAPLPYFRWTPTRSHSPLSAVVLVKAILHGGSVIANELRGRFGGKVMLPWGRKDCVWVKENIGVLEVLRLVEEAIGEAVWGGGMWYSLKCNRFELLPLG